MIKKITLYVFVFLLSLLLFLVAFFPANVLWEKLVQPQVNLEQLGLRVDKIQGTVWQGQALIHYRSIASIVDWDVDLSGLLALRVPAIVKVNSQVGSLNAKLRLGTSQSVLLIDQAEVKLAGLNALLRQQRVTLDGLLFIKNLQVELREWRPVSAFGMASWSGGNIAYPAGREVHERNLPMFKADLDTQDGAIRLAIRDANASFDVISATLDANGQGMMSITRRLLDLSNEPWSLNSREQDVVFKVKKDLFKAE